MIEEKGLRETLDSFHTSLNEENSNQQSLPQGKVIKINPWLRYVAAACVLLLITWTGFTFLNNSSQNDNERLFANHFKPDPGLPTTMSSTDNYEFYNAMVSYKQAKYSEAIVKWEALLKEKPKNDTLNYFLGVAHLANGNEGEAITFLQWAAEHQESVFSKETYYYLGLANIKKGNLSKGKELLKLSELPEGTLILEELKNN